MPDKPSPRCPAASPAPPRPPPAPCSAPHAACETGIVYSGCSSRWCPCQSVEQSLGSACGLWRHNAGSKLGGTSQAGRAHQLTTSMCRKPLSASVLSSSQPMPPAPTASTRASSTCGSWRWPALGHKHRRRHGGGVVAAAAAVAATGSPHRMCSRSFFRRTPRDAQQSGRRCPVFDHIAQWQHSDTGIAPVSSTLQRWRHTAKLSPAAPPHPWRHELKLVYWFRDFLLKTVM